MPDNTTPVTVPTNLESAIVSNITKLFNKWLFFVVLTICISIIITVGMLFWFLSDIVKNAKEPDKLFGTIRAMFVSETNTKHVDARIYRFWTPSEKTIKDLEGKTLTADQKTYYSLDHGNDTLVQFAQELKPSLGAQGYTRFESVGEGTGPLKSGWTWELTIPDESTHFTEAKLFQLYSKYFHRTTNIYFEVIEVGRKTRRTVEGENPGN
jgi:hypothetical protein